MYCLRQDLQKNLCGICNPALYNMCMVGTKKLIQDYHTEIIKCIQFVYYYEGSKINIQNKLSFFAQTKHSYGNTALFLSGGAGLGKFHIGVMKALYEQDLFPRIIAGSSIGALTCAGIASLKYCDLWKAFNQDMMVEKKVKYTFNTVFGGLKKLLSGGPMIDMGQLKQFLFKYIEQTFNNQETIKARWLIDKLK